jgi:hypothetical protein
VRIGIVSRSEQYDAIHNDEAMTDIVEAVREHPHLLRLVAQLLREFQSLDQLRGLRSGRPSAHVFAQHYRSGRAVGRGVDKIVGGFDRLYMTFNEGNVRGAVLEALVESKIRSRYGGADHLLTNNVVFRLSNGQEYVSSTSIDVIGFDGERGECVDCKARSRAFAKPWIDELVANVVPRGLRVGLATADSTRTAERELKRNSVSTRNATIVTPDNFWQVLPLQPG